MTLAELKKLDCDVITPAMAAEILHCNPHYIRVAARECPERLGFPVFRCGNRTHIPRLAFIKFMEGEK